MKLRKGVLVYIESELYHYHDTLREIDRLRRDILFGSVSGDNAGGGRSNLPGDLTALKAVNLVTNKKLERMEATVAAIECILERLQPEKVKLLQMMYFDRPRVLTWEGAAMRLHITKKTAYRWKREVLLAIAERGGFI